jgi:hypothetical protein
MDKIVKEALKEARNKLRETKRANSPSSTNTAMANRQKSNPKARQASLNFRNTQRNTTPLTQTGTIRTNVSIGSRTLPGAQARHTRLRTATTFHLDRAHPKDVVVEATAVEVAPTEAKEETTDGFK